MLIPHEYKLCVGFIVIDGDAGPGGAIMRSPRGTAFLIAIQAGRDVWQTYAVTAGHVVEQCRAAGSMYLRLNLRSGGYQDVPISPDDWTPSGDTDLAAAPFPGQVTPFDVKCLPPRYILTEGEVATRGIEMGDDVFFIGLFERHPGVTAVRPIARFGNISLLPHERIPVEQPGGGLREIEAYLVEARSWGGNSGSPCFVYFPADRHPGGSVVVTQGPPSDESFWDAVAPKLLGLVQGHFNLRSDPAFEHDATGGQISPHSGIAVVIPAHKIIELLMDSEFVEQRERLVDEHGGQGRARMANRRQKTCGP